MRKIILASTSPRRKELLEKTGLNFDIATSDYEEDMTLSLAPKELVIYLSQGKAQAIAGKYPDAIIIAADTIVVYKGAILGKPHTDEKARDMLNILSGNVHSVITSFTVLDTRDGKIVSQAVESTVYLKQLTKEEIDKYIATKEPLDKAGAYAVQGIGSSLIDRIEGSFSSIVGLPIEEVLETLKEFGVNI
jgi:septum formation protein